MVSLTFDKGYSRYSSIGFAALGSCLCKKRDKDGYEFAKLGLILLKKCKRKEIIPTVYSIFYTLVSHYHEPIHDIFNPLLTACKISFEVGSHEESILTSTTYFNYGFLSGKSLKHLLNDFSEIDGMLPLKTMTYLASYEATLHLCGKSSADQIALVCGDRFKYMSCFDSEEKGYNISRVSVICAAVAYLFCDYTKALEFVESCRQHEKHILPLYSYPIYIFYVGLISLELAKYVSERNDLMKHAEESIKILKCMAEHAPMNYLHKYHLLEAEMAVVVGNNFQAVSHYHEAIRLSQKNCFLHEEGISCERAGIYYLESNSLTNATKMFKKSHRCFQQWGAVLKLQHMKKKYSQYYDFESLNQEDFISSEVEVHPISTDSASCLTDISA